MARKYPTKLKGSASLSSMIGNAIQERRPGRVPRKPSSYPKDSGGAAFGGFNRKTHKGNRRPPHSRGRPT